MTKLEYQDDAEVKESYIKTASTCKGDFYHIPTIGVGFRLWGGRGVGSGVATTEVREILPQEGQQELFGKVIFKTRNSVYELVILR